MSLIDVADLTFSYDGSFDFVFSHVSFQIDTDWKLGFTGRNGRGKTTFLNLLMGKYEYTGKIISSVSFEYFPFEVKDPSRKTLTVIREEIAPFDEMEERMKRCIDERTEKCLAEYAEILERYTSLDGFAIDELIKKEILKLDVSAEALQRPFDTLSYGERTKVLLAGLFLKKNSFLLIDEPTNHLDQSGRETISQYLNTKKGFVLVSHDRMFLDSCIDHIMSINKTNIEIQKGNFATWTENKEKQDRFERAENEKLKKEVKRLKEAAKQTADWSDQVERSKKGKLPKGSCGIKPDKGYIGHKAAKMMKRSKIIEERKKQASEDKAVLLLNIENKEPLLMRPLDHPKNILIDMKDICIAYGERTVIKDFCFAVNQGDRIALNGKNGSGKSSILKLLTGERMDYSGDCHIASGLVISYIPQNIDHLQGSLRDFAKQEGLDESLFKSILRKLDFSREQFQKDIENFSEGQKKKLLLASSILKPAHLYLWDEPLNFIDVLSRMQIEDMIRLCQPTMIFVEHDRAFCEHIATKTVKL